MVSPGLRRRAAGYLIGRYAVSQRRACRVADQPRSSARYRPQKKLSDALLAERIKALSAQEPSWGYRSIHRNLGIVVSLYRLKAIYRNLGLALKTKRKRRLKVTVRHPLVVPKKTNDTWAIDFVSDRIDGGPPFRTLTGVDIAARECVVLRAATSFPASDVIIALEKAISGSGKPNIITCDNGPEFRSNAFQTWAAKNHIDIHFIQPGKPMQNAFCESFNGTFRRECLNKHFFTSLGQARFLIHEWKHKYNHKRGHSSLRNMTPAAFALTLNGAA